MSQVVCYPGPGHIYQHRKQKRHCMGLHPLDVMFSVAVELEADTNYVVELVMFYTDLDLDMETVWGGGGQETIIGDDCHGTVFRFMKHEQQGVTSSVIASSVQ